MSAPVLMLGSWAIGYLACSLGDSRGGWTTYLLVCLVWGSLIYRTGSL